MKSKLINLTLSLCLSVIFVNAQIKDQSVTLSGTLLHFSNAEQVQDMSAFEYLRPVTNERMVIPDSNGRFSIRFEISSPDYFRIGRNILYLTPGDNLKVVIDFSNPAIASFSGRGSAANLYLRNTPFPKAGSFIAGGEHVEPTPQATVDTILKIANHRKKELKELHDVSTTFKKLENARIRADVINSLQKGEFYIVYVLKLKGDTAKEYLAKYRALAQPVIASYSEDFVNPLFMKLEVYRDIADGLTGGSTDDMQQIKDWYKASSLVNKMQQTNNKQALERDQSLVAEIKTTPYREAAEKMLQYLLRFGKGDIAVDFTATNISGDKVALSSLKGKIIYVDLWATWCGPCLEEMPHFDKLKKEYKDNTNVAFVSLSIDDNIPSWLKSVATRNATGYQWNINRNKLSAYNIVGIPRVLLIDKDFKIADMNAPLPSSPEASKAIDRLLK